MKVNVIGYVRVSTNGQTVENQKQAISAYCSGAGLAITEWIEVCMSSRKDGAKRKLDVLKEKLKADDVLIVSELSRLARSVGQIANLVESLVTDKKVRLVCIKEGMDLNGKRDMASKVMLTMFSLFAEIERDLISERTKEGLARARSEGKLLGRPKGSTGVSVLDGKESEIKKLLAKKVSISSVAKIMEVSYTCCHHFISSRGLKP